MRDCIEVNPTRVWRRFDRIIMRKLIVMPDDTIGPLLEAIGNARQSLRIKMFSLSEPRVLDALRKAHKRKVNIRVLLNPARRNGEIQNRGSRQMLLETGI